MTEAASVSVPKYDRPPLAEDPKIVGFRYLSLNEDGSISHASDWNPGAASAVIPVNLCRSSFTRPLTRSRDGSKYIIEKAMRPPQALLDAIAAANA